jgi:1-acyl-sn-glycerol-3-phosphate acyltransferase
MKRIAFWLYQVYVWLVFYPVGGLLTLLAGWGTGLVAVAWSPEAAGRYVASSWGKIICWLTPVWVTVEGAKNANPGRTYVVVCNHQSQFDIFLIYGWLKLDLKWVLKAELRKIPAVGIGCEKAGHIFVDRGNPRQSRKAVSDAMKRVGNGVGVLFFAEGTRSQDGKLLPFKRGAFQFATRQQLPILPVTIIGTRDIQRPKSLQVFPGKISLVIHPPIEVDGAGDSGTIPVLMEKTRNAIASALPGDLR